MRGRISKRTKRKGLRIYGKAQVLDKRWQVEKKIGGGRFLTKGKDCGGVACSDKAMLHMGDRD